MRMLSRDSQMFHSRFYEASAFVYASNNRYECYELACTKQRSPWQVTRIKELLKCPACRETWFVVMLRGDCKDNGIEELLLEAGL